MTRQLSPESDHKAFPGALERALAEPMPRHDSCSFAEWSPVVLKDATRC